MPRDLAELSYARHLRAFSGEPESDMDYETEHVDAVTFDGLEASGIRFTESAFTGVEFAGGVLRYARFDDVWLRNVRFIGTNLGQSSWLNTEFVDSALSGVEAVGSQLRRIRFEGCKFDSVNLRNSVLQDVGFVDCVLRDTDFGEATLRRVSFPGSRLDGVALHRAALHDVDLRGAVALDLTAGIEALKGATISTPQLMDLAPAFARAAGITVRDN
ncbi:pentapeptide repeat-containing protein [Nocardia sp. CDC159]|uniref:Pentapeptide repeat-containing protein n=1 Tax=Nocardia pulmonis TaxID=2951408 RepID=A0A9X2J1J2_9NOCA|nr:MULTISPECIES: pentapeptide repeat-containing protein [Nocardia]MCM6778150.1 pentapeptide repeat-containing protein [Nocardia pulmonis]MCM6791039.1 pentapeptide repeat-containing protein [Nocardia sp. CDC159]